MNLNNFNQNLENSINIIIKKYIKINNLSLFILNYII